MSFSKEKTATDEAIKEYVNSSNIFDLARFIGEKAAKLLYGKGYSIESDEDFEIEEPEPEGNLEDENNRTNVIRQRPSTPQKDKLATILESVNFTGLLYEAEINLSMRQDGVQAIIVDIDGNNNPRVTLADMDRSIFISNGAGDVTGARTFRKIQYDNTKYEIMEVWSSTGKNKTTIQDLDNPTDSDGNDVFVGTDYFNTKVKDPSLQVKATWDYSDFLTKPPLVLFANYPTTGNKSFGDGIGVRHLQFQLDQLYIQEFKENIINRSRFSIPIGSGEAQKINNGDYSSFSGDAWINNGVQGNDPDKMKGITMIAGNPLLNVYSQEQRDKIDEYATGCGYSPPFSQGTEQTVVGTLFTKTGDVETTAIKLSSRRKQINIIVPIIQKVYNSVNTTDQFEDDVSLIIAITPNVMMDETTRIDKLVKGVELGIVPLRDQIREYYGITNERAIDQKVREIEDDQKQALEFLETNTQPTLPDEDIERATQGNESPEDGGVKVEPASVPEVEE